MTTLAEYLAESLISLGIKNVYGVIGTSILDFVDTLYSYRDRIRYITTRHEQTAISMADGEYRVSGNYSAALVHAGPGFLNSLLGLGVAYKDRVPILLISGGVKRRLKGSNAWLEIDQQTIAKPLTKYSVRLEDPDEIDNILRKLVRASFTKPYGPSMIEIPEDIWGRELNIDSKPPKIDELKTPLKRPSIEDIEYVVKKFLECERPAILVCGEAALPDIENILEDIASRLGIYIITTGNARGACKEGSRRCLGRVGFGGGSILADKVLETADLLLVLGDELDDITTYNYLIYPEGDIIVVSESPDIGKRHVYYDYIIDSDPKIFIEYLLEYITSKDISKVNSGWDEYIDKLKREWMNMVNESISRKYDGYVNPAKFFKVLAEYLPEDAIISGGQGVHIVYTYVYMKLRKPRRFLAATNLGAMSYAFPAAMGAKVAYPDTESIAVVGDGEFMMAIQDFETCVREDIPVKVVVVNDNSYRVLLLRQRIQKMGRIYGTILSNPSFEGLARLYGGEGYTVDDDGKIMEGIELLLNTEKPFILDLIISPEDLPPINIDASLKMAGA